jgi:hypothetical protein
MGIINRLKSGAGRVKNGLKHIHPLWADKDVVRVTTGQEPPPRAEGGGSVASEGKSETKSRTERPWFLDGEQEDEGWDGTNPGEAWSGNKTETDPTEQ